MMRSRPRLVQAVLVLAVSALPLRAQADPIVITSGFLSSEGLSEFGRFVLSGAGLETAGNTDRGLVRPALDCSVCTAGDVVQLSSYFSGSMENRGTTLDGAAFTGALEGEFRFDAVPIIAPATPADFTVEQPFRFTGMLSGLLNEHETLFDRALIGQGHLTANFAYIPTFNGLTAFQFVSIRYEFHEPAPVPEPATLLLIGSGLAGFAIRYRNRRAHTMM